MIITSAVLAQMPRTRIDVVVFYKRDKFTTDLICCDIEVGGMLWTFHEEVTGWPDLIAHLSALPGFRVDWYEAVANPPFAPSVTVAFDRRQLPQSGN